ncbi:hypothetical protein KFE25_010620 [Diacronema lutheri]|uniref:Uncharacterized protein n=1 Tax=Diacronema lutheri TaxID=2081491 RepID=A0A8J5X7Z9_DIALT|nr:hypothetical protein KFE25_010620 [Diacronema lutheri]
MMAAGRADGSSEENEPPTLPPPSAGYMAKLRARRASAASPRAPAPRPPSADFALERWRLRGCAPQPLTGADDGRPDGERGGRAQRRATSFALEHARPRGARAPPDVPPPSREYVAAFVARSAGAGDGAVRARRAASFQPARSPSSSSAYAQDGDARARAPAHAGALG